MARAPKWLDARTLRWVAREYQAHARLAEAAARENAAAPETRMACTIRADRLRAQAASLYAVARIWSKHHLDAIAYLPERPAFVGESSGGARADFAVMDIRRGLAPVGHRVKTEWWVR
jgi:hypothetical protein